MLLPSKLDPVRDLAVEDQTTVQEEESQRLVQGRMA